MHPSPVGLRRQEDWPRISRISRIDRRDSWTIGVFCAVSLSNSQIEPRLDEVRRRLLDLTRRNRLLNHRGTGNATLHVVDELPEEVFRVLVTDGRRMQFLAREEASPEV